MFENNSGMIPSGSHRSSAETIRWLLKEGFVIAAIISIWAALTGLVKLLLRLVTVVLEGIFEGAAYPVDAFVASGVLGHGATIVILASVSIYVLVAAGTIIFDDG